MMRRLCLCLALMASASAAAQTADIAWTWEPAPPWLEGVGGVGGLSFGSRHGAGVVEPAAIPPIQIVFDADLESVGRSFDLRDGLADLGPATFRGAAYDVSDPDAPRRLNVGIYEDSRHAPPDRQWQPDDSADGGNEILVVFASDYDQAAHHAGRSATGADVLYRLHARQAPGRRFYATDAVLTVTPAPLRDLRASATPGGRAVVQWTAARWARTAEIRVRTGSGVLGTGAPEPGVLTLTDLNGDISYAVTVEAVRADGTVLATRPITIQPIQSTGIAAASVLDPLAEGSGGDVAGYTAPDGTEYALWATRGDGVSILDITAAPQSPPVEVGFASSPVGARDPKDVKVFGHHAYLAHETGPVTVIDLADPAAPVEVARLDVQPGVTLGGSHNVFVADGHLWVVGGSTQGNAGLRVYSLADPAAPAFVGAFQPAHQSVAYYHDVEVRDGRAYAAAIYGGGIDVLDVSDPADIRLVTTFTYPGAGAHNTCTSEDGQTVYVGDEIGDNGHWMRIFDVTDVEDAELVGEIIVNGDASVHNCSVRGDRLFVAHYTEGLRVFDISDPHVPIEVAVLDTFAPSGTGYRGAWTAFSFPGSGKVVVSDMQSGVWVARLADAEVAAPLPGAVTLQARPNPTASATRLRYQLEAQAQVRLALYDVRGRQVAVVVEATQASGPHAPDLDVSGLPAGVYLAVLTVDGRRVGTATVTAVR